MLRMWPPKHKMPIHVQARVLSIPKHTTDVPHAIHLRTESGLTVEVPVDKLTIVLRYYLTSAVDANTTRSANIKMLSVQFFFEQVQMKYYLYLAVNLQVTCSGAPEIELEFCLLQMGHRVMSYDHSFGGTEAGEAQYRGSCPQTGPLNSPFGPNKSFLITYIQNILNVNIIKHVALVPLSHKKIYM